MNLADPCRAAILLVEDHGSDAKANAIRQIAAFKAKGDAAAERAWMKIFGAIVDLEATEAARRQVAEMARVRRMDKPRR